jgi:cell division septation protein DedD
VTVIKSPSLPNHAQDDAFHEIQLNGKQLVFLFMVVTVVSVVIFLCGVFVGRGVRSERAATSADAGTATPVTTPDVVSRRETPPAPAGTDPTAAAPPPAVDELTYFNRLEKAGQPEERLKPTAKAAPRAPTPAAAAGPANAALTANAATANAVPAGPPPAGAASAAAVRANAPPGNAAPVNAAPGDAALAEPSGGGFALQITALRERREAESIAKRLSARGYAAYVLTPAGAAPSVYRVRVGKFKTRHEAETIAAKLQKEEQFTPWITR